MTESYTIDVRDILERVRSCPEATIYEDDAFMRRRLVIEGHGTLSVVADYLAEYKATCLHFSFDCKEDVRVIFRFSGCGATSDSGGLRLIDVETKRLYWIPQEPKVRLYDCHGKITKNIDVPASVESGEESVQVSVSSQCGCFLELAVIVFDDGDSFAGQFSDFSGVETRHMIRDAWFVYENICDTWKYLVNGFFYSIERLPVAEAWPCEHPAYFLYNYLSFLYGRTGKSVYAFQRDLVAYSLMLTLPSDGRWRHGVFTDVRETHTGFQGCGIYVLMAHYRESSRDIFLKKAYQAVDYLVTLVDEFGSDRLWFLHDSLETSLETVRLHYEPFLESEAFGKSLSNTLTLNTHVWTLVVLKRFYDLTGDEKYLRLFDRGMGSLEVVLGARPATFLYRIVYGIRDMIIKSLSRKCRQQVVNVRGRYESILRRTVLPAMKRRFPRLIMPNGYTERDLSYTNLSDYYNAINIQYLLVLYGRAKNDLLRDTISSAVRYFLSSGYIEYVTQYASRPALFVEILLMYAALIDESALCFVLKYLKYFRERGVSLQVDLYSSPLIACRELPIRIDNEKLDFLTSAYDDFFVAAVFNCTDSEEQACIQNADEFEIVDSKGNRIDGGRPVSVGAGDYVKIVKR